MKDSIPAQLTALPGKSIAELKDLWRELYQAEPPPYNRGFLVTRLAYRIQELAYGGLSARTVARLDALADEEEARLQGLGQRPGPYVPESPDERLSELAEILAAGVQRLRARETARKSSDLREFPLDFAARPSVHERPETPVGENQ